MINKPLVSIVIPTYNQRETFLRECIESAINQTYTNVEIVISDNYSTNNASIVIDEYAVKDKRIRVVKPDRFLSMSESFLFVFKQAKGEYICYVSSDDVLMPPCVEILAEKMILNETAVFSHGKAIYFNKDNTSFINWKYFNEISGLYDLNNDAAERLLNFAYVCFGGCLIKKSVWSMLSARIETENLLIQNYLDLLMAFLLLDNGHVYFHNDVLVRVRLENDSRNFTQSYLIRDAASIWNFIESENKIVEKIQSNSIDIHQYKKRHFINFNRALVYEYAHGYFGLNEFKNAVENLNLFKLSTPIYFTGLIQMILHFPKLSLKLYWILYRIRGNKVISLSK